MALQNYRTYISVHHLLNAGKQELLGKLGAIHLLCEYVDVVMWFVSVGLLPEHPGLFTYLFCAINMMQL